MAFIADSENFPDVPIWFTPIDKVASESVVDRVVIGAMGKASIWDACFPDAGKDDLEFVLIDSKAVVLLRHRVIPLVKIERQPFVDIYWGEGSDCSLRTPSNVPSCRAAATRSLDGTMMWSS